MKKVIVLPLVLFFYSVFAQTPAGAYLRVKASGVGFELVDSTNFQTTMSIGTAVHNSPLTVTNFNTTFPTPQTGTIVQLASSGSTNGRISFDTYNGTNINGSIYQGRRAAGTPASPSAALADYTLVGLAGDGYGVDSFHNISLGGFFIKSQGTMTNTSAPTYLTLMTTPTASTTAAERMRILSTGAIKFNTYGSGTFTGTPAYTLQVDATGNVIEGSASSSGLTFAQVSALMIIRY